MHDVEFATMASHEGMTRETNANGNFLKSLKCIAFKRDSVAYYSSGIDINIFKGCSDDTYVDDNNPFLSFLVDENTPIFGIHWSGKIGKNEGELFYVDVAKDPEVIPWNEGKLWVRWFLM